MRKIEHEATDAFHKRREYRNGGTEVRVEPGLVKMTLHGNTIAFQGTYTTDSALCVTLAGHPTRTTRSRLNALLRSFGYDASIWQHGGTQYAGLPYGKVHVVDFDELVCFDRDGNILLDD